MSRTINFQTVSWFWDLYTRHLLDLEPPYQRRSVWNQEYKDFFIDTVLNEYPAPAIFLYQEITPEGVSKYGVVDGKQRLSTLFSFAEKKFPVSETATITRIRGKYFTDLENEFKQKFWKYQFAVEYVQSDDEVIINNIFDRINRNVSKLTPQELRHAKFSGIFITTVEDLTDWMISVLPQNFPSIPLKARQQMKDVEFVTLLLLLLEEGVKSYRQDDLDKAFNERDLVWEERDEIEAQFKKNIELIKELLNQCPSNVNICKTRLKNQADFYSLFGAVSELNTDSQLQITSEVCNRIDVFFKSLDSPETRINIPEVQDYCDAISTSLGSAGINKNKTRINILKSVISGTVNL
ncbi:DUF262 domain-containing protein [Lyngbya sp. CCAP 1446/10]|uniref:DUF262 domain-containing protein n=1 Tax=Lyngbya sp. CCAP 1446/10 TaxID=439293 RepID=UPI002237522A|nr:DUF262 domain-containing protein [Lyngbya sp. CCAP 1446/10]MCW6053993.1 DUF262 domain-containing protein [Lyngbya sp. CCAP 1446/10]